MVYVAETMVTGKTKTVTIAEEIDGFVERALEIKI